MAVPVARIEEILSMHATLWSESPKKRDHIESQGIDGRIILK
jgi:hypothetical protein